VSYSDDVTNVEGNIVVLIAQATKSQNGPYVVGAVSEGHAALTRPSWWTGAMSPGGPELLILEGTTWVGTIWRPFKQTSFTVDTDDPMLYPEVSYATTPLVGGTGAASYCYIADSVTTRVTVTGVIPGNATNTRAWRATSVVAGSGDGVVTISALGTTGAVNASDTSSVYFGMFNYGAQPPM
jgi:hypothetical protein